MLTILSAIVSLLTFRLRSRASLELELIALRHQVTVLRRQRPGRLRLLRADRILWIWLYRIWPRAVNVMVLVKPATLIQWHRKGFRLYWRWRSGSHSIGRPKVSFEIRVLIRQMSMANPLWGAPRIHGELLKLGIEVSQATVGRCMPWRPNVPSPTWRAFLQNHMHDIAAVDMFVVATAAFRFLYAVVVLGHDRRKIIHFDITAHPTQAWLSRQMTEAFPWDTAPRYLLRDRDASYGQGFRDRVHAMGIKEVVTAPRSPWQNAYVVTAAQSIGIASQDQNLPQTSFRPCGESFRGESEERAGLVHLHDASEYQADRNDCADEHADRSQTSALAHLALILVSMPQKEGLVRGGQGHLPGLLGRLLLPPFPRRPAFRPPHPLVSFTSRPYQAVPLFVLN